MKARKNLYLSVEAVARGERPARRSQTSLSDPVEQQLLQIPEVPDSEEEFWSGPAVNPRLRENDPRSEYLTSTQTQAELRKVKKEIAALEKKLTAVKARKAEIEQAGGK